MYIVAIMSGNFKIMIDKIIFLDFDGVLVSSNQTGNDCFGTLFDLQCIESLNEIISKTGAGLVITSSWGNYLSIIKMKMMWYFRKLPGHICGVVRNNSYDRSEKIDIWLLKHKPSSYIIIDDMDYRQFGKHHHNRLLTVKSLTVLTPNDASLAIALLSFD